MSTQNRKKLKQLFAEWPNGVIYTQIYLTKKGYSPSLVRTYRKNGWLESIGRGAYKRFQDSVNWLAGLHAIQSQLELPVHVGGKTALELKGWVHYARQEPTVVYLFAPNNRKLPKWFLAYDWGVDIQFKNTNILPFSLSESFSVHTSDRLTVRISSPERAMMEILHLVPQWQGFDEAYKLMELLPGLRPVVVQKLLETCQSYKVKRLFLFMAERISHPWFKKLNLEPIDLGKGNRVVVPNGIFDRRYLITVPREYEK